MNFSRLRQYRQPWVIALVLALLLLTGWGQVHRVLHTGIALPLFQAQADGVQTGKAHLASHEEGSSLCQLLDHLSQGSVPVSAPSTSAVLPLPLMQAAWATLERQALVLSPFEARGPPHLA